MQINNPLYKNQGIHVVANIFTVEKGETKVLLIKRTNEPFKDKWALVSGALYNNEDLEKGLEREIKEKTGLSKLDLSLCNVYGNKHRSRTIGMRMVAVSYIGVIDNNKVQILNKTSKTDDAEWFPINKLPKLAYDHNEIIEDALNEFKNKIVTTNILKSLFPEGFTIPEIQKTYESILNKKFDRRNFRRKILSSNLIKDTKKTIFFEGKKPAKLYIFKNRVENKEIF